MSDLRNQIIAPNLTGETPMIVREYPALPVTAVGGVILRDGKVLLIRRAKPPLQGKWSIPGGAVELGETLQEALRREIAEETGLTVKVGKLLDALNRIIRDSTGRVQFHYVLVDYVCSVETGELHPASDVSEACWVDRSEISAFGLREETLRIIDKAFIG